MSARRTHLRAGEQHRTACGTSAVHTTEDRFAVTCRSCIKRMAGMPVPADTWSTEDVVRYVLAAIGGPAVEPYPTAALRDEWAIMSCRAGAPVERCGCAYCAWERRWRPAVDEWQRNQPDRPHRRYEHPFGSVAAALSFWAWWQTGAGRTLRSSTGTAKARMEAVGKLGTEVQVTRRTDRDAIEITRAGQAVDIGRAVERCFADEQRRRGLSAQACIAALVRSLDATLGVDAHHIAIAAELGVSERLVRALLGSAKREITIELAARDMIPEPRSKVGLGREIAARREAYERSRARVSSSRSREEPRANEARRSRTVAWALRASRDVAAPMRPLLATLLLGCALSHAPPPDAACHTGLVVSEHEPLCIGETVACREAERRVCVDRTAVLERCGEWCAITGNVRALDVQDGEHCHAPDPCGRGMTSRCVPAGCEGGR